MTIEKIEFTNKAYVAWLKRITPSAKSIGLMLRQHCSQQSAAAFKTMEELGFEKFTDDCWQQAGELILNNDKIEV